jgi:hypothetical protein
MDDGFDLFLRDALAPPVRPPDRDFVARVQRKVALDRLWRAQRRAALVRLGQEVLALAAVAAALIWIGRAPPIRGFATASPAAALATALFLFALLLLPLAVRSVPSTPRRFPA